MTFADVFDESLFEDLVRMGGFLFLVDGLNEIDEPAANELVRYLRAQAPRNPSCCTTQAPTGEAAQIKDKQPIGLLNKEIIDAIISTGEQDGLADHMNDTIYARAPSRGTSNYSPAVRRSQAARLLMRRC